MAGVNKVIVAVNQLDAVDWSEARYKEMCTRLESFFARLQCRDLYYVPTSGYLGLNLERRPTADEAPKLCAWYAALRFPPRELFTYSLQLCLTFAGTMAPVCLR